MQSFTVARLWVRDQWLAYRAYRATAIHRKLSPVALLMAGPISAVLSDLGLIRGDEDHAIRLVALVVTLTGLFVLYHMINKSRLVAAASAEHIAAIGHALGHAFEAAGKIVPSELQPFFAEHMPPRLTLVTSEPDPAIAACWTTWAREIARRCDWVPLAWETLDEWNRAGIAEMVRVAKAGGYPQQIHDTWVGILGARGFRAGPRDYAGRTHPWLRPWAELMQPERDLFGYFCELARGDRDASRASKRVAN